ncbi:MAG: VWA domain-containing protein [Acidobacteriales bacterium]|nr:VWA domain-containing protein [Terriglobales bacterium]
MGKQAAGCALAVGMVISTAAIALRAYQSAPSLPATPAIRVSTRLVVLDVVASGKDGMAITDLKSEDFKLEENGKQQKISGFGLERAGAPVKPPALPPGVYSNRPEYHMPSGALTVLLIDGLNTPYTNQARVREQMIRYAATQMSAGQQTAVYALGSRLVRLQDFTSDPRLIATALSSYKPQLPSVNTGTTLAPLQGGAGLAGLNPGEAEFVAANIQQFEGDQTATALQYRIQGTLAAMQALSRILGGNPGRKNLVWVTASLPFSMIAEQNDITYAQTRAGNFGQAPVPNEISNASYANHIQQTATEGVKRVAALMTSAQISVYPVDAKGLLGATLADASRQGSNGAGLLMIGGDYGEAVSNASNRQFASQATMEEMAQQTGGRAYINRNDIDRAVALAAADGSTYYSLSYYPEKKKFDGGYRKLKVVVSRPGVQLRYRPGYFAIEPEKVSDKDKQPELISALAGPSNATMVVFDARIVPPAPAAKVDLPVQFLVQADTFTGEDGKNGERAVDLDFYVTAFTKDGKMAANTGKAVATSLPADQYLQMQQKGLLMPVNISLPPGSYDLRLAVRDNHTGYVGTLSVPLTLKQP